MERLRLISNRKRPNDPRRNWNAPPLEFAPRMWPRKPSPRNLLGAVRRSGGNHNFSSPDFLCPAGRSVSPEEGAPSLDPSLGIDTTNIVFPRFHRLTAEVGRMGQATGTKQKAWPGRDSYFAPILAHLPPARWKKWASAGTCPLHRHSRSGSQTRWKARHDV
jgi:hypothetical protein